MFLERLYHHFPCTIPCSKAASQPARPTGIRETELNLKEALETEMNLKQISETEMNLKQALVPSQGSPCCEHVVHECGLEAREAGECGCQNQGAAQTPLFHPSSVQTEADSPSLRSCPLALLPGAGPSTLRLVCSQLLLNCFNGTQNNPRMVEFGRGLWRSSCPTSLLNQGHLQPIAQD